MVCWVKNIVSTDVSLVEDVPSRCWWCVPGASLDFYLLDLF